VLHNVAVWPALGDSGDSVLWVPQVVVCCIVLQCVAVCCSAFVCCSVLQHVAACCSVLQCVSGCCSVLQFVAVCCSVLQCIAVWPASWDSGDSVSLESVCVCVRESVCVSVCKCFRDV